MLVKKGMGEKELPHTCTVHCHSHWFVHQQEQFPQSLSCPRFLAKNVQAKFCTQQHNHEQAWKQSAQKRKQQTNLLLLPFGLGRITTLSGSLSMIQRKLEERQKPETLAGCHQIQLQAGKKQAIPLQPLACYSTMTSVPGRTLIRSRQTCAHVNSTQFFIFNILGGRTMSRCSRFAFSTARRQCFNSPGNIIEQTPKKGGGVKETNSDTLAGNSLRSSSSLQQKHQTKTQKKKEIRTTKQGQPAAWQFFCHDEETLRGSES